MANPVLNRDQAYQPRNMGGPITATTRGSGVFSIEGVTLKTGLLFGILLTAAAATWFLLPADIYLGAMLPLLLGGLVLGLIISFSRSTNPFLISAYAAVQGAMLGGLSAIFEGIYPGLVMQAVLATLSVFGVTLVLYRMRILRATPKMMKFFIIAMAGYFVFGLVNLGLMLTGVTPGMFGLYSADIPGTSIPFGIVIGIFAVLLAAFSLVVDFSMIEHGVENRLESRYEWQSSFGLMVTLVWLYIEFLRLFAILRGNN